MGRVDGIDNGASLERRAKSVQNTLIEGKQRPDHAE
jgi:hypothetical protein